MCGFCLLERHILSQTVIERHFFTLFRRLPLAGAERQS
jgi:hypothetical protein